ncbi:MAG: NADH-quinone oxidoreductase subunit L, partial [Chloroflexota bacterium]|nr:NADH-quinone oxidoreductase subunit L [Chloroflexota bacterium]
MEQYLYLIPLLPFLAFLINLLWGRSLIRDRAHWVAVPAVFLSWLFSVFVFFEIRDNEEPLRQHLFRWIPAGDFNVDVTLYADQLTAIMLLVVTTVGFLVHVYSVGYMHGDGGYYRFFAFLPLFVFSMLMLVLADNFLLLFVFWEGVGLCSYLLIGFWFKRRSAINAARKAFVVNRIGDLGFGLGIMWIFAALGTIDFYGEDGVFARVPDLATGTVTGIALLLFLGACGKSAQFPLHVWLPDAMEGPTPVSALIHAATMVTAGIYMVARTHAIFEISDTAMLVVALIGAFTALMAATIGLVQNDIKRVVAYSTLSQLGYMAFALGTGAWVAAIFHLMTHAFFKALLFLGSGSVIHGMEAVHGHDPLKTQDMRHMGGLKKYMPITYWTLMAGSLALAGAPLTAGFFSKDEILVGSWHYGFPWAAIIGWGVAFMTAFYTFRMIFMTFHGEPKFDTSHPPHESPLVMTLPLIVLAVPSLLIGALVGWPPDQGPIHTWLGPVFEHGGEAAVGTTAALAIIAAEEGGHSLPSAALTYGGFAASIILSFAGIGLAWMMYGSGQYDPKAITRRF